MKLTPSILSILFTAINCISAEAQHSIIRTTRVWTIRLHIEPCDVKIHYAKSGLWNTEKLTADNLTYAHPTDPIFQWTTILDVPPNPNYKVADLFADMSKTIYYYEVTGNKPRTGFSQPFWISPLGLSTTRIDSCPARMDKYKAWTKEEEDEFLNWYTKSHQFSAKNLWRKTTIFKSKLDSSIDVTIKLGNNCPNP